MEEAGVLFGILGIAGFILFIVGIVALNKIATSTRRTNSLLRMLLNDRNPERFEYTGGGMLRDNKYNKN
ncbi:MAG: hypothetical protein RQ761_10790 [Bacteroidales bacterium]|nr:hypothetical protein [Bacteroidales bacterium]